MKPKIAKVVVGLPVDGPFDYAVNQNIRDCIAVGRRVRVSFNRRNCVGFVVGSASRSRFKNLNPILSVLDEGPVLDQRAFALAKSFSAYYGCSLGEAIETCLPKALRQDKSSAGSMVPPAPAQRAPTSVKNKTMLVHDWAGHQRWPFIVEKIKKVTNGGKSVIVLVPDIFFVKEASKLLSGALDVPITVLDKTLKPKNELSQWEQIKKGEYKIIIGTRSAVFAPIPDLGLIVIDEEENSSYKQEQTPHYHVHEVALMRSQIDHCRVMFVSSAPSAEIWEQAKREKWEKITLEADGSGSVQIIDMTNYNPRKTSILSFPLQNAMQKALENNGKVVLFMNRLGFSTRTQCQQCGFILQCERCNVPLTYLYSKKIMVCGRCNFKTALPKICPACNGSYLRSTGTGMEKLESEIARFYPSVHVRRFDRETKVFPKKADVIVATQAIFRQHNQWNVSLVAVLNFDAQIHHVDFRSGQRAFSLLVHLKQLAKDKLLVQTRMADNYCIKAIKDLDFDKFYREELKQRRELGLPPYKHLVALGLRGIKEDVVFEQSLALFSRLEDKKPKGVDISDPHPDISPKLRGKYRFTILLKGRSVKAMLSHIKTALKGFRRKSIIITINVDP